MAIIEGLTEFLPVSSTGHLIIAQKIMGIGQVNEFFTVVLQLAAVLASVIYFRKRIFELIKGSFSNVKAIRSGGLKRDLGLKLLIAIIPTLIIAYLLKDTLAEFQNSVWVIGISSIVFGSVFFLVEQIFLPLQDKLNQGNISLLSLIGMGIAQGMAVIPGVSRSGITISTGITQGLNFADSIELSFIMGIPVMIAASGYEIYKSLNTLPSYTEIGIGMAVTFLVALLGIKISVGLLAKKGFVPFVLYRIIFGVLIILLFR
jgi:undecaprenyl-diphosphatase